LFCKTLPAGDDHFKFVLNDPDAASHDVTVESSDDNVKLAEYKPETTPAAPECCDAEYDDDHDPLYNVNNMQFEPVNIVEPDITLYAAPPT
jgi:hypothetical protein